jgi:hypothetical protein
MPSRKLLHAGLHHAHAGGIGRATVITTPLTFCATVNTILSSEAGPRGHLPDDYNIDPGRWRRRSPRTEGDNGRTVGSRVAWTSWRPSRANTTCCFEDADAAGRRTAARWSAPSATRRRSASRQNMTTGEGGMVTTNNDEQGQGPSPRLHGMVRCLEALRRKGSWYYEVLACGSTTR